MLLNTTAISLPLGLKATSFPVLVGNVAGFEYLVPKPADQGYTLINGLVACATAISLPLGLKATPFPVPVGNVAGFEYLVPKPANHGYTLINGLVACATAISPLMLLLAASAFCDNITHSPRERRRPVCRLSTG